MDMNEIKESRNEVSKVVLKPVENIYGLASMVRVLLARFIDLIFAAIAPIIVISVWKAPILSTDNLNQWGLYVHTQIIHVVVNMCVSIGSLLFFLVILPSFTKGTTIGKGILGIRLKRSTGDKKVKWYMLLVRETYFLIIPSVMALVMEIIGMVMLGNPDAQTTTSKANVGAQIVYQLGYVWWFLWFIFLLVETKFQDEHQSWIDMKFGLVVVYKDPIRQVTKEVIVKEKNLVIADEPGNLSADNIAELKNDEQRQFDKSISLEDLDLEITPEKTESKKGDIKSIEKKEKDKKDKGDKK